MFQANRERRHNLIVVVPSTPAQYFHCLRRQIHRYLLYFILSSSNLFICTHSSILYVFFSYYHGLLFLLFSSRPSISHLSSLLFLPLLSSPFLILLPVQTIHETSSGHECQMALASQGERMRINGIKLFYSYLFVY